MNDKPPPLNSEPEHSQPDVTKLVEFLSGPMDIRSLSLTGLFILAFFYTLYLARVIFLPLTLALLISFVLAPVVRALRRVRIPEALGAALVIIILLGAMGYGIYSLYRPASQWMAKIPQSLYQIEYKLGTLKRSVEKATEEAKKAREQVKEITEVDDDRTAQIVKIKEGNIIDVIFSQTSEFLFGLAVIIILLYFLLASGDLFLLKLVRVLPRLKDKKGAVEIANQTEHDISIYLLTITIINACLGTVVGFIVYLFGMPNAVLWGVMVGLLNFIPYMGALVGAIIMGLAAFITFDDMGRSLMLPALYFGINALEGNIITPMILGRRLTLNPLVIFLGLIFWGWIWGIPGAIIAVPMIATFKIICDHIEPLAPIGEFLGK